MNKLDRLNASQPIHSADGDFYGSPSVPPLPSTATLEMRWVTRFPKELRLHPAFQQVRGISTVDDLNSAGLVKDEPIANRANPVLITKQGVILAGFGRWRIALLEGTPEINCIEYPIGEDEALSFILSRHRACRRWNRFVLIRLALTLEPALQEKALKNMQAGGKYKGSAILPKAQHIDVREKIGNLAGVSAHYVSDVKALLRAAHSTLIDALTNGTLSIPGAMRLTKYLKIEQLERFTQEIEEKDLDKVIRKYVKKNYNTNVRPDVIGVLEALLKRETQEPGSVRLRHLRGAGAEILVVQALSSPGILQGELKLHEVQGSA
jgi:hypothetical protein